MDRPGVWFIVQEMSNESYSTRLQSLQVSSLEMELQPRAEQAICTAGPEDTSPWLEKQGTEKAIAASGRRANRTLGTCLRANCVEKGGAGKGLRSQIKSEESIKLES